MEWDGEGAGEKARVVIACVEMTLYVDAGGGDPDVGWRISSRVRDVRRRRL